MTQTVPVAVTTEARSTGNKIRAFAFGDAEPVLDGGRFLNLIEVWHNGRYYEPPVNPRTLSKAMNLSPHHRSAIALKVNLLVKYFVEHPVLSAEAFERFVLDYLVQGNAYLEAILSRSGAVAQLEPSLAQNTRVGLTAGSYWWIDDKWQEHEYAAGRVLHLRQYDTAQEIYGLPEYLSAFQSMLLNEAATLFRRRYYLNGAHAGFILYINDEGIDDTSIDAIEQSMKDAKGVGNFKNMFIHSPKGKDKGVQILPISEVAAKDEFLGIKNTSRDDILAGWRTPPQLMGVVPANAGGFGDVEKASDIFFENEIVPLQRKFRSAINRFAGREIVVFEPRPKPAGAKA
ncbi:phage portal protein [Asticcacaulis sp. BYS171W]|uniref:Phage portal protein n=1 Tax=Asticcacaulis aquaticus TaxID=2984212 RepID=A0ABT5HV23_9CAUL|nr:phage portal protein [Asticcacaulis aquaticus]MDC7683286.1 phage portal protein [Asticcacaulis aquaticus]